MTSTAPQVPATSTGPPLWALPAAVVGGFCGAMQARINADLAAELDDGFLAAAISFGTGLLILLVLLIVLPGIRRRVAGFWRDLRRGAFPAVMALGGLGGATYVLGQSFSVALLGMALFFVCVVAGQTVTGLIVDRFGLGPGRVRHLTAPRLVGAALMVASVALAMSGGISTDAPWFLLVLPMVAGIAMGLQQAVNGRVSQHSGHFLVATLANFAVGTTVLVIAAIISVVVAGPFPTLPTNPVLYLGGVIGVAYIALAAHLAGPLGILTLAMSTIAGQILGSVVIDAVTAPDHLTPTTIAGTALALLAAVISASNGRRISRR